MKHLVIPDPQVKPGVPIDHFTALGNYIVAKQPDKIINLGDHWDMPSLRKQDPAAQKEGRNTAEDIQAGNDALDLLMAPIVAYNKGRRKKYKPQLFMLRGNHEDRITRRLEEEPDLKVLLSQDLFNDKAHGWKVVPFLKPINLDGIEYAHYFYNQLSGIAIGGSCLYKLNKLKFSFTQGHVQVKDIAELYLSNGKTIRGLVAGAFYQHYEEYRGPQANSEWRGIIVKHEVKNGNYSLMEVSLSYLLENYL